MTLEYTDNISFADARKRLQPSSGPSKNPYVSVTQTPAKSLRPLQPWARNIRPPTDFKTEVQFLKYILDYWLTWLDAIGNEQIPVHHTFNEATREDPVQNNTATNTNDTTQLNNNTAASNAENNVDMGFVAVSATEIKRSGDDDSSDEESRPNAKKMSAANSRLVSSQTHLCQNREKEEIC